MNCFRIDPIEGTPHIGTMPQSGGNFLERRFLDPGREVAASSSM